VCLMRKLNCVESLSLTMVTSLAFDQAVSRSSRREIGTERAGDGGFDVILVQCAQGVQRAREAVAHGADESASHILHARPMIGRLKLPTRSWALLFILLKKSVTLVTNCVGKMFGLNALRILELPDAV